MMPLALISTVLFESSEHIWKIRQLNQIEPNRIIGTQVWGLFSCFSLKKKNKILLAK